MTNSNSPLSAIEQEQMTAIEEETHLELQCKDGTRLFKNVPDELYKKMFKHLLRMRVMHPSYRDDQLLMFMLCQAEMFLTSTYDREGFTKFRLEWNEE